MPTTADILPEIQKKFPQVSNRPTGDCPAFNVPVESAVEFLTYLRDAQGYDMLVDLTAVDWNEQSPRFSVVYHLLSTKHHEYIRVVTDCANNAEPAAPTASGVFPAADWHERECYDMFGIRFTGHPDLRRILMWEEYPYHPLRKEFPLAGNPTDLADSEIAVETGAKVLPAPLAGGPFVAPQKDHMSRREPRARDESWNEKKEKPSDAS